MQIPAGPIVQALRGARLRGATELASLTESSPIPGRARAVRRRADVRRVVALPLLLAAALMLRANFVVDVFWQDPYGVHHGDEHFLPFEALAMWEGVTPRELGWPAATTRLVLSATYAVDMTVEMSLHKAGSPPDVMDAIARWTRAQQDDSRELFALGRWMSAVIGLLQVLATYWAVGRWTTRRAALLAALMCAVSPVAVRFSQWILADMTGVLFATCLLGLLAPRGVLDRRAAAAMGVVLGLATASKYHFALWVPTVALALWAGRDRADGGARTGLRLIGCFAITLAATHVLLVPWTWTNPLLVLKEFLATVVSKVSVSGTTELTPLRKLFTAFGDFGWLTLMFVGPGAWLLWRRYGKHGAPLLLLLVLGVILVQSSAQVYDRYGLPFLPVAALLSAIGLDAAISIGARRRRIAVLTLAATAAAFTVTQLAGSQRDVGRLDSYARAHSWLLASMPSGSRIAVDSLYPRHLPRTREQLSRIVSEPSTPAAYRRKLAVNGYHHSSGYMGMRAAVLNDELYTAHWAQRELAEHPGGGFEVVFYDREPRFNSVPLPDAVDEFVRGLTDRSRGYDVLLLRHRVPMPIPPAQVFEGQPGPLYLYARP